MIDITAGQVLADALTEIGKRIYQAEDDLRQETYRIQTRDRELEDLTIANKKAQENYFAASTRSRELEVKVKSLEALLDTEREHNKNLRGRVDGLAKDLDQALTDRDDNQNLHRNAQKNIMKLYRKIKRLEKDRLTR